MPVTLTGPSKVTAAVTVSSMFSQPCAFRPSADASTAPVTAGAVLSTVARTMAVVAELPASSVTTARKR